MAAGEFLPPVLTRLTGDIGDLAKKIEEAKALIKSIGDTKALVTFEMDKASLAAVKAAVKAMGAVTVPIAFDISTASLAKLAALLGTAGAAGGAAGGGGGGFGIFGMGLMSWIKLLHNLFMVFGAQLIVDTAGIIAFGAAVVGTMGPVISNISNLGAVWNTFSGAQKVAALNLKTFIDGMAGHDVQVVTVFDSLLSTVAGHMTAAGGATDQAAFAFMKFAAQVKAGLNAPEWQRLFGSGGEIGTDVSALLTFFGRLANALVSLAHNFNFLGLWALSGLGMVLKGIVWLNNANPTLARFALLALGAYHAITFLTRSALGQWVASVATAIYRAAAATTLWSEAMGVSKFTAFFQILTGGASAAAIASFGLAAGFGAVVLGLGVAYVALSHWNSGIQATIQGFRLQDGAVGTNIQGYEKLIGTLKQYQGEQIKSLQGAQGRQLEGVMQQTGAAIQQAAGKVRILTSNFGFLEHSFGLTQQQAYQVAKALGLVSEMGKKVFGPNDKAAITSYMQTLRASRNPMTAMRFDMQQAASATLGLTSQVQGLTNAFNLLAAPFATALQDTVTWKQGNGALKTALQATHGQINLNTKAGQAAASALATQIQNTVALSTATLQSTGSYAKASGVIRQEINYLKGLHSNSGLVRQAIALLQKQLNALKSKSITITANIVSSGSITVPIITTGGGVQHLSPGGYAGGTPSARPGWSVVGEHGAELVNFGRGGQRVLPHHLATGSAGAAASGGGGGVTEVHLYLDSKEIFPAVKKRTYDYNVKNGNRTSGGRVRGVMVPR